MSIAAGVEQHRVEREPLLVVVDDGDRERLLLVAVHDLARPRTPPCCGRRPSRARRGGGSGAAVSSFGSRVAHESLASRAPGRRRAGSSRSRAGSARRSRRSRRAGSSCGRSAGRPGCTRSRSPRAGTSARCGRTCRPSARVETELKNVSASSGCLWSTSSSTKWSFARRHAAASSGELADRGLRAPRSCGRPARPRAGSAPCTASPDGRPVGCLEARLRLRADLPEAAVALVEPRDEQLARS